MQPSTVFAPIQSNEPICPSLLAPASVVATSTAVAATTTMTTTTAALVQDTQQLANVRLNTQSHHSVAIANILQQATKWNGTLNKPEDHPVFKYLSDNKQKQKGWLRKEEHLLAFQSLENYRQHSNLNKAEKKTDADEILTFSTFNPFCRTSGKCMGYF